MSILRFFRYIINILYTSLGRILLSLKQMILCSFVFIIRVSLLVVTMLDNTIDLGTGNVISSKKPHEIKYWLNNVKFSSPNINYWLNIQEDVKLKLFTKLEEEYANPNSSQTHTTWRFNSPRAVNRSYSITWNLGLIFNVLSKNCLSSKEILSFIYIGYYASLPKSTFGSSRNTAVMWHYTMAFLLCDDIKEAYEVMTLGIDNYDNYEFLLAGRLGKFPIGTSKCWQF